MTPLDYYLAAIVVVLCSWLFGWLGYSLGHRDGRATGRLDALDQYAAAYREAGDDLPADAWSLVELWPADD